jgi:hypothetical protein
LQNWNGNDARLNVPLRDRFRQAEQSYVEPAARVFAFLNPLHRRPLNSKGTNKNTAAPIATVFPFELSQSVIVEGAAT